MAIDLSALQAAADGGKQGLAEYDRQKAALQASQQAALQRLLGGSFTGVAPERLAEIGGRGIASLEAGARTAGMRQQALGQVPGQLEALAGIRAQIAPYRDRYARERSGEALMNYKVDTEAERAYRKTEADKAFEWRRKLWNVQHHLETF